MNNLQGATNGINCAHETNVFRFIMESTGRTNSLVPWHNEPATLCTEPHENTSMHRKASIQVQLCRSDVIGHIFTAVLNTVLSVTKTHVHVLSDRWLTREVNVALIRRAHTLCSPCLAGCLTRSPAVHRDTKEGNCDWQERRKCENRKREQTQTALDLLFCFSKEDKVWVEESSQRVAGKETNRAKKKNKKKILGHFSS